LLRVENCFLKTHPDFNKSGPWEKSAALAKLKAKYPDDESRHRLNRKVKIDGTELAKPIETPKRGDKAKGKKGTAVPLDDDATITNMVAAADATADSTMYRECVITTNASNCRIVKGLFNTGSSSYNFVREEVADWIESEEWKTTPSDCPLSMDERHQPATVSLAGSGAHTVVSDKSVVFNLLLFNEINKSTERLPCLIARTLSTSKDLTIRKHDLVLKIPSHFTKPTVSPM